MKPVATPRRPRLKGVAPATRAARGSARHGAARPTVGRPQAQRLRGRRSRRRWAFIVVLVIAVAGITISEAVQYRQARVWAAELFLLEEIRVTGAERFSTEEILGVLGLARGETDMADVVPMRIHDAISAGFPDLRDVIVTRDVPAGTLTIDVTERQPVARVLNTEGVHVIDRDGVILARPFAAQAEQAEEADQPAPGDHLPAIATDTPATAAGMLDGPEVFRALRLMRAYEHVTAGRQSADRPFRLGAIDARDASHIEVGLVDAVGTSRAAVLAEPTIVAGLYNVLLVAERRRGDGPQGIRVVSPDGDEDDTTPSSGGDHTEFIDARFESTVYVKSIPGGQDG